MLDATLIGFRPLRTDDLPLLRRWLLTEHVRRWWDPEVEWTPEAVAAEWAPLIANPHPTACFVVTHDDRAIGYIQTYPIADNPEHALHLGVTEDAAGLDLFIGEPDSVHRGLGAPILRHFLREIVFAGGAVACWIDPDPANTAAIRAYEKAGFRHVRTVAIPGQAALAYVMRIAREDVCDG